MHPILFRIPFPHWKLPAFLGGGEASAFPIYSYGVMLCISLIVGWYLTLRLAQKDGLPRETMANCYVVTAIAAVVGARVLFILTNLSAPEIWDASTHRYLWGSIFSLRTAGLVAYGGFLGGMLGSWAYCRYVGVNLLAWADVAVPSLAAGVFITRIGCYMYGCDFGMPLGPKSPQFLQTLGTFPEWHYDLKSGSYLTAEAWSTAQHAGHSAIVSGAEAVSRHTELFCGRKAFENTDLCEKLGSDCYSLCQQLGELRHSLPVHPTQIYESLAGLLLFVGLMFGRRAILARRVAGKPTFRGELFLLFVFGYALLRFMIEWVRDDQDRGMYGPQLSQHLILPAALALMSIAFLVGLSNFFSSLWKPLTRVIAIALPFGLFLLWMPKQNEYGTLIQLSTSQWIALVTAVAAGLYYWRGIEFAKIDPQWATDLGPRIDVLLEQEAAERQRLADKRAGKTSVPTKTAPPEVAEEKAGEPSESKSEAEKAPEIVEEKSSQPESPSKDS
jgi:phosphatidylglycerol:prolipoprotein diacylglycerol transferase